MSKIEQIIAEMEEYIDNCRFQPLSNSKIIVNKDEIDELLDDLKQNIPDEVRKYQRIIANRDAILRDAQDKADEMIKKANEMTSTLVSEHEIMQQAFREANIVLEEATTQATAIVENATAEANDIRSSAMQYTDESLENIQTILNTAIEGLTVRYDGLLRSLQSSLDVANRDRRSLQEFTAQTGTGGTASSQPQDSRRDVMFDMTEDLPPAPPAPETPSAPTDFVENTFAAEDTGASSDYGEMTLEDVLGDSGEANADYEEIPDVSDYGSVDEIKDFDLAFDDFK